MKTAQAMAGLSHDYKTKVGCVLVKDRHIVSTGYNGTPKGTSNETRDIYDNTQPVVIHAELNALLTAGESVEGATCYITLAPCLTCAAHLKQCGIVRVVYLETKETATQLSAVAWLKSNGVIVEHADTNRLSSKEDEIQ